MKHPLEKERRAEKRALLRRILTLARMTAPDSRTPQERFMQSESVIGVILFALGLVAALILGLPKLFTDDWEISTIAMMLIFGGMLVALGGAWLVQYYYESNVRLGKGLFAIFFAAAVILIIVGLVNIFTMIGIPLFLLTVGFAAAFLSALALK